MLAKPCLLLNLPPERADTPSETLAFRLLNSLLRHTGTCFAHVLAMLRDL